MKRAAVPSVHALSCRILHRLPNKSLALCPAVSHEVVSRTRYYQQRILLWPSVLPNPCLPFFHRRHVVVVHGVWQAGGQAALASRMGNPRDPSHPPLRRFHVSPTPYLLSRRHQQHGSWPPPSVNREIEADAPRLPPSDSELTSRVSSAVQIF